MVKATLVLVALAACGDDRDLPPAADAPSTDAAPPAVPPRAGSLDPSFGRGGLATFDIGSSSDRGRAVVVQPDGKIVVGGEHDTPTAFPAIARYNADGSLDTSFGRGGVALLDGVGATTSSISTVRSLALQADGKIVATIADGFHVVRLLPDGTLDPTFAFGLGEVIADFAGYANGIAVQPDGKLVIAGEQAIDDTYVAVALRLSADGGADTSFGDNGYVVVRLADYAMDVVPAIDPITGGVYLGGWSVQVSPFAQYAALVRLTSTGALDPTFATGGIAQVPANNGTFGQIGVTPTGDVMLGGTTAPSNVSTLVKFTHDGALDTAFGQGGLANATSTVFRDFRILADGRLVVAGDVSGGYTLTRLTAAGAIDATFQFAAPDFGAWSSSMAVALDAAQRIVVAGVTVAPGTTPAELAVARFTADGAIDPTFAKVAAHLGPGDAGLAALALDPLDGAVVGAGFAYDGTFTELLVARFTAAGALDDAFGTHGHTTVAFPTCNAQGRGVAVLADRKILVGGLCDNATVLARFTPDGALDPTFGTNGKVMVTGAMGFDAAIAADGSAALVGGETFGATYFSVSAFDASGAPAAQFGASGVAKLPMQNAQGRAIARTSDGGLVAAGFVYDLGTPSGDNVVLARLTADGAPAPGFGASGVVQTSAARVDYANAIAVAPGGASAVVAGGAYAYGGSASDFLVERYDLATGALQQQAMFDLGGTDEAFAILARADGSLVVVGASDPIAGFALVGVAPDGTLDPAFGDEGVTRTRFGAGIERGRAQAVVARPDGRFVVAGYATTTRPDTDLALAQYFP